MVRKEEKPSPSDEQMEETSTEFYVDTLADEQESDKEQKALSGLVIGWLSVISSLIAFFLMPLFFAALGIIGGVIANFRANDILGYTAIILAILAFVIRSFISPF